MPTSVDFGDEFLNLNPVPFTPASAWFRADDPRLNVVRTNARALQFLVNSLHNRTPSGGYVYFSPGRYYIGKPVGVAPGPGFQAEAGGDIVIPPNVTLWFAPGAVLVPVRQVATSQFDRTVYQGPPIRIEIHGAIIAGVEPIFDVLIDPGDVTSLAGRVLLLGNGISEVYPEWWGANPGGDAPSIRRTTLAIQAAIDAAYHDRVMPSRHGVAAGRWKPRPAIPVVMTHKYVIDQELHVGVATADAGAFAERGMGDVPTSGFELIGERGVGEDTIIASAGSVRFNGESVLAVRGPTTFSIRNVGFSGQFSASCVTVAPFDGEWGYSSFEGCSFKEGRPRLVSLDAETFRFRNGGRKRDFWNIVFTRCHFEPLTQAPARVMQVIPRIVPDQEGNLVGVDVKLGESEGLEFRNCAFANMASPMVRAFSGRFAFNECNLHTHRPFHPALVGQASRNDFRHGADVSIEVSEAPEDAILARVPDRVVPATFTARECQSNSVQFLATHHNSGAQMNTHRASPVIVLNLNRTHEHLEGFHLQETDPPSIYWEYLGEVGCPLILVGCTAPGIFAREGQPAAERRAPSFGNRNTLVYYMPYNLLGSIYNIGNVAVAQVENQDEAVVSAVRTEPGLLPLNRIRRFMGQMP